MFITYAYIDLTMNEKGNSSSQIFFPSLTIRFHTFLFAMIIIVSLSILNQDQIAIAQQQQQQQQQQQLPRSETKQSLSQDKQPQQFLEDLSFDRDGVTFSHHMASVNGIQMHYVMGGKGDPVVLLHGFPQSWYEWRHIMPALAKNYTVVAPDLR